MHLKAVQQNASSDIWQILLFILRPSFLQNKVGRSKI